MQGRVAGPCEHRPPHTAERLWHAVNGVKPNTKPKLHNLAPPVTPQALDARTPATAAQPGGLSRVAAALATTVRRPRAGGRLSLASGGTAGGLLDLEGCASGGWGVAYFARHLATGGGSCWLQHLPLLSQRYPSCPSLLPHRFDANGEHSGAGTPLLRQQLLAGTPAASGALGAGSVPRSAGAAAATPVEVKALRDEVAALRKQVRLQPWRGSVQRGGWGWGSNSGAAAASSGCPATRVCPARALCSHTVYPRTALPPPLAMAHSWRWLTRSGLTWLGCWAATSRPSGSCRCLPCPAGSPAGLMAWGWAWGRPCESKPMPASACLRPCAAAHLPHSAHLCLPCHAPCAARAGPALGAAGAHARRERDPQGRGAAAQRPACCCDAVHCWLERPCSPLPMRHQGLTCCHSCFLLPHAGGGAAPRAHRHRLAVPQPVQRQVSLAWLWWWLR